MSIFLFMRLIGISAGLLLFGLLQPGRAQTFVTASIAVSAYVPARGAGIHPVVTYAMTDGTRVLSRSGATLVTITY